MKLWSVIRIIIGFVIVIGPVSMSSLDNLIGGAASAAPPIRSTIDNSSSATLQITLPLKKHVLWPDSIALSPNGKWLAVVSNNVLLVRDMRSRRWIRYFSDAYYSARWHPTKAILIVPNGDAHKPNFYMAFLSSGKKHQLFRSDPNPYALITDGMLVNNGIVIIDVNNARTGRSGNFGYKIPWVYDIKTEVRYMSSGSNDQVAVEFQSLDHERSASGQWVETYCKIRGRKQWIPSGKIVPQVKGNTVIWQPRQPNWLGDGRLVYLRIYPDQWMHLQTSNGKIIPKALTAKNRAELWVCNANCTDQRKITTLWDLRLYSESQRSDWISIDRQGKNLYYISGKGIRHMSLVGKL